MARKILIIDDEQNVLDFLDRCVRNLKHEPVPAATCRDALAALEAHPDISIVIADIFLPDSPGPTDWIKNIADKSGKRTLILITGLPSPEILQAAGEAGIKHFLTKPFELPFLHDMLKKLDTTNSD
jgi:two-component system, response regulator, stage 0 sporulation protein F